MDFRVSGGFLRDDRLPCRFNERVDAMTVEIQMLAWSVALGLVQILLAAALMTHQRGLKWNTGARDGKAAPLSGVAARMERASHNFLAVSYTHLDVYKRQGPGPCGSVEGDCTMLTVVIVHAKWHAPGMRCLQKQISWC